MIRKETLINDIDALLPQTQCGLCDYQGCHPYATAIVNNESPIDHCLPGGVETLRELAHYLNQDPSPYIIAMEKKAKPVTVAVIREEECIGCTKCTQVCPTDAIIGASKLMHTVITNACTGCELCLLPCPVDCIDIKTITLPTFIEKKQKAQRWRSRYENKQRRLIHHKTEKHHKHQQAKLVTTTKQTLEARKATIYASVERVRAKRRNNESSSM